ncbi:hypothetical protein [Bartonella machadoae]|uniref:hypothetical protein n=1 Tax=Bartonella machadoae TaxID=2893471 RepID=UPI001F4D1432|nr:hypothetical protein [Bartonella machadoae]UNE53696.1 hypothetical protein LNM86_08630 [Bartonella machadoae]
MSVNEILLGVVIVVFLFSGIMFRFACYYRSQVKALKEEVRKLKHDFLRDSMKMNEERDRMIKEKSMMVKRRDQAIEKLKRQIKQYENDEKKLKRKAI